MWVVRVRETDDDSVLQYVGVCCRMLQCVAVCCSVLQCAAVSDIDGERAFAHVGVSHTTYVFISHI